MTNTTLSISVRRGLFDRRKERFLLLGQLDFTENTNSTHLIHYTKCLD